MPYPAYQGKTFFFEIVVGHAWRHEFPFIDRATGEPTVWEPGWQGLCVIRDNTGTEIARLTDVGPVGGADGQITFADGMVALDLASAITAGIAPTSTYSQGTTKAFLFADLTLTDPLDDEPYLAASGKGVAYLPTTIGA